MGINISQFAPSGTVSKLVWDEDMEPGAGKIFKGDLTGDVTGTATNAPWGGITDKPFETIGYDLHVWSDGSLHKHSEIFASFTGEATYHTPMNPSTITAPTILDDTHAIFDSGASLVVGGTVRSPDKVDLTDVDYISICAPASCAGVGHGWAMQFGVFDAYTNVNQYSFAAYLQKDHQGWTVDTDLDVRSLTGEYYCAFYCYSHTMTDDVYFECQDIKFYGGQ